MLVLRRKTSEAIVLNGVIVVRVLGVEGDRVKIGISAPPDVIVVREELLFEQGDGYHGIIRGDGLDSPPMPAGRSDIVAHPS